MTDDKTRQERRRELRLVRAPRVTPLDLLTGPAKDQLIAERFAFQEQIDQATRLITEFIQATKTAYVLLLDVKQGDPAWEAARDAWLTGEKSAGIEGA